jgi:signal peptidase I
MMNPLFKALASFSFPAILLVLTVVTGLMWLLDLLIFAKKRKAKAAAAVLDYEQNALQNTTQDAEKIAQEKQALREHHLRMPWWLEYSAGFFSVIFMVFVLRSFVFEPFRIPSASMMPTLQSGDLILVNKFSWGLRMPVFHNTLIETGHPDRGDVIVFRFPPNESMDFIKRVVALPGDTIEYTNKVLSINGTVISEAPKDDVLDETGDASNTKMTYVKHFVETLPRKRKEDGEKVHSIFNNPARPSSIDVGSRIPFNHQEACEYLDNGIRCTVPAGHYFAMGDNRDNSQDSRWWGFVPEGNIVGNAVFIWMNLDWKLSRLGRF